MAGIFNWSPELEPVADEDPGAAAAEFAELMAEADVEQDPTRANELYAQGEELGANQRRLRPDSELGSDVCPRSRGCRAPGTERGPGRLPVRFDAAVVVVEE
jgi:hypothetical protein